MQSFICPKEKPINKPEEFLIDDIVKEDSLVPPHAVVSIRRSEHCAPKSSPITKVVALRLSNSWFESILESPRGFNQVVEELLRDLIFPEPEDDLPIAI